MSEMPLQPEFPSLDSQLPGVAVVLEPHMNEHGEVVYASPADAEPGSVRISTDEAEAHEAAHQPTHDDKESVVTGVGVSRAGEVSYGAGVAPSMPLAVAGLTAAARHRGSASLAPAGGPISSIAARGGSAVASLESADGGESPHDDHDDAERRPSAEYAEEGPLLTDQILFERTVQDLLGEAGYKRLYDDAATAGLRKKNGPPTTMDEVAGIFAWANEKGWKPEILPTVPNAKKVFAFYKDLAQGVIVAGEGVEDGGLIYHNTEGNELQPALVEFAQHMSEVTNIETAGDHPPRGMIERIEGEEEWYSRLDRVFIPTGGVKFGGVKKSNDLILNVPINYDNLELPNGKLGKDMRALIEVLKKGGITTTEGWYNLGLADAQGRTNATEGWRRQKKLTSEQEALGVLGLNAIRGNAALGALSKAIGPATAERWGGITYAEFRQKVGDPYEAITNVALSGQAAMLKWARDRNQKFRELGADLKVLRDEEAAEAFVEGRLSAMERRQISEVGINLYDKEIQDVYAAEISPAAKDKVRNEIITKVKELRNVELPKYDPASREAGMIRSEITRLLNTADETVETRTEQNANEHAKGRRRTLNGTNAMFNFRRDIAALYLARTSAAA